MTTPARLDAPLSDLRGVGPRRAAMLAEAGLATVGDLLFHLPFRYEDRSHFLPIAALVPGVRGTVRGTVVTAALRRTRARGLTIFEAVVQDDSGALRVVFFNQPYLRTVLTTGRQVILYGETTFPADGPSLADAWRAWRDDIRVDSVDSGLYLMEEAPEATLAALDRFL